MASYEAIYGSHDTFHRHMSGVGRMLSLRGSDGLSTLGLDGFLARLLLFIDTNSAFLLGTKPHLLESQGHLPRREPIIISNPQLKPNLERSVGLIVVGE